MSKQYPLTGNVQKINENTSSVCALSSRFTKCTNYYFNKITKDFSNTAYLLIGLSYSCHLCPTLASQQWRSYLWQRFLPENYQNNDI